MVAVVTALLSVQLLGLMDQLLMRSALEFAAEPAANNVNASLQYPQRGQGNRLEAPTWLIMGHNLRYAVLFVVGCLYIRQTYQSLSTSAFC